MKTNSPKWQSSSETENYKTLTLLSMGFVRDVKVSKDD